MQDRCLLVEVLNQSFSDYELIMTAGDTGAADPLDTVHHEMDSVVHSHHFYKSV